METCLLIKVVRMRRICSTRILGQETRLQHAKVEYALRGRDYFTCAACSSNKNRRCVSGSNFVPFGAPYLCACSAT